MLTIEVKLSGHVIAEAEFLPIGDIVNDGTTVTDDFSVEWTEDEVATLCTDRDADDFVIMRHRRGQTVWALVAKAAAAILGQKVDRMEGEG
jgi:hypothetical protein